MIRIIKYMIHKSVWTCYAKVNERVRVAWLESKFTVDVHFV